MAYFPANPGLERQRKGEKKKLSFRSLPTWPQIENWKKKSKKIQKIRKHQYGFFLWPKQVGKGRESAKIKIIISIISNPTPNREFQKNSKKIHKIKKHYYGLFLSEPRLGKAEKGWKKKLSFRSFPTNPK